MDYTVVIPAAGQGKRMNTGKNKQLLDLQGKPLIVHTLMIFQQDQWCQGIVLVVHPVEIETMKSLISDYGITKVITMIAGGKERQDSVFAGLQTIKHGEIVLIHDGARPFVKTERVHSLVQRANETDAAVLAVPVKDTIKKESDGFVTQTIDRSSLWAVQTPQAFRLSLVQEAHRQAKKANIIGTDDASLVESMNQYVAIVEGDYENIKLTTPDDLIIAGALLKRKQGGDQ